MAKKIIKAQMKQRLDTKANWASQNPVLLAGELGIVSDYPNLYKVGDGVTAWNDLPLRGFDGNIVQELGDSATSVMSQKAITEQVAEQNAKLARLDQEWNAIKYADFTLNPNIEKVVLTESEVTLEPGKYYTWETPMAYLDIALIPPTQQNYVGKYIFSFTCPLNAPTYLNLPVGLVWNGVPDFKAGDTYLVFVYDNLAIFFADPKVETGFVTATEVQAMIDATIVSSLNTPV